MRFALLLIALWPAWPQMHSVAGVVMDATTGTPMKRVRVTLTPSDQNDDRNFVLTKEDGRFSFDVPKGKFLLFAEHRGYRQPFGQSGPGLGFNVAIYTGPDQPTSNLVFKWYSPGAISGKVVDEREQPVIGALIQLIAVNVVAGRKTTRSMRSIRTDDRGFYRFGNCAAGSYYLAVTGEPWDEKALASIDNNFEAGRQLIRTYLPSYYPNAIDPKLAQPLTLAPGGDFVADFRLSSATGTTVRVHIDKAYGTSLVSLVAASIDGVNTFQQQKWMYGSNLTLEGVLPGRYELRVDQREGAAVKAMVRRNIDVASSDMTVNVELAPTPIVAGKVTFLGKRPSRGVYVRLIDESTNAVVARSLDSNDEFNLQVERAGRFRLQLNSAEGFFARTVEVKGAPARGKVIEIQPGARAQVEIAASNETGSLKGLVLAGDQPVLGVLAMLAPAQDTGNPDDYHPFQTDSDGSFEYKNIPIGDYILFAVERLDLEFMNPQAMAPYRSIGMPIRIEAQTSRVQNIQLTSGK